MIFPASRLLCYFGLLRFPVTQVLFYFSLLLSCHDNADGQLSEGRDFWAFRKTLRYIMKIQGGTPYACDPVCWLCALLRRPVPWGGRHRLFRFVRLAQTCGAYRTPAKTGLIHLSFERSASFRKLLNSMHLLVFVRTSVGLRAPVSPHVVPL